MTWIASKQTEDLLSEEIRHIEDEEETIKNMINPAAVAAAAAAARHPVSGIFQPQTNKYYIFNKDFSEHQ